MAPTTHLSPYLNDLNFVVFPTSGFFPHSRIHGRHFACQPLQDHSRKSVSIVPLIVVLLIAMPRSMDSFTHISCAAFIYLEKNIFWGSVFMQRDFFEESDIKLANPEKAS